MRIEVLEAEARAGPCAHDSSRTPDSRDAARASRAPTSACPSLLSSSAGVHVGRRRRHRRGEDVLEQPLAADGRRRAGRIRRHRQHARLAQQAPAVLVGERHAPEVAAVDAGNAVVPRELFVEERVVRRQQIDDAAVRLQLIVEEQLRLPARRRSRRLSSNQGNFWFASGVSSQTLRVCSHWPKKLSHQRRARTRVGEHAPHLLDRGLPARAACRGSPGRAARRPGCCSTGRTTGARPARHRRGDRRCPERRRRDRPRSGTGNPG